MTDDDLKQFAILGDLEPDERDALAAVFEELRLEPGSLVFEEGEPAEGLLLVAEGGVRVASTRGDSAADLGPGACLGTFALVESGPREAYAETTSRARILVLRRSAFRRFTETDPRAACRLLEAILRDTARLSRQALEDTDAGVDPLPPGE